LIKTLALASAYEYRIVNESSDAAAVSEGSKKLAGGDVNDVAGLAGLLAEVLMGDAAEDSKETAAGGEETAAGGEGS
jgi:hypothetical protein